MKKKILIRIGSLRHGGAEKVLVTFLKNLSPEKYEIDLLLNLYSGKYLKEVPSWINIYYLNKGEMITTNRLQDIPIKAFRVLYQGFLKKYPQFLYNYKLSKKEYDIEFAAIHTIGEDILNSPNKSSKKIVWIHNDLSTIDEFSTDYMKNIFRFDKIMVISSKIENDFKELASTKEEMDKVVRILNPIDSQEIINMQEEPIDFKLRNKMKTFISVGTNLEQKGYDRLVKIHSNLINKGFQHQILIVGENSVRLKQLVKQYKVEESFILLGYQKNPYPFFKLADYYIMSSRYEGYPTVLFEALLLNKYILTTDVSGASDIITSSNLGQIVENNDTELQNGMEVILKNDFIKFDEKIEVPYKLEDAVSSIEKVLNQI